MNPFFADLGDRFARAAALGGAEIVPPSLDPVVADELLELTRVVAHTEERRFAPLAAFMAGVAAERLAAARGEGGNVGGTGTAELIHQVRVRMEQDASDAAV